jgi:membrane protein insertase Oxa1/YidC/SpoIIIJ
MLLRIYPTSFCTAVSRIRDLCFRRASNRLYFQKTSASISSIAISIGSRSVGCGITDSFFRPIYRRKLLVHNQQLQKLSSDFSSSSWMPAAGSITIWGGCGWLITTLHMGGTMPYWVCMSLSSLLVRTCLLPLVVQGAHTQVKFASIAPDIQFLLTLFQQDRQMMKMDQRTQTNPAEMSLLKRQHFQASWRNLRYIYKSNNVHPLDIFKVSSSSNYRSLFL